VTNSLMTVDRNETLTFVQCAQGRENRPVEMLEKQRLAVERVYRNMVSATLAFKRVIC
jgi:hypothetical protein